MDSNIIIRKVNEADIEPLAALYDEVWPEGSTNNLEKANFVLRYSNGVSYCAEKNGRLVGSRTSIYMPVFFCERKIECVQFADSCVHDSCRRQGLFLRMNTAFLEDFFNEKKGELVYNISEDTSRAAYEKLGWVYIKSLTSVRKYVRPYHILKLIKFNLRKLKGAPVFDPTTVISSIDDKLLQVRENLLHATIHVRYDINSFTWRMKSRNGINVYKVDGIGAVVYKKGFKPCGAKVISIGEVFLYKYNKKYLRIIEKALLKKEHADIVICSLTIGHPLFHLYKKLGYWGGHVFFNHGVKAVNEVIRSFCYTPKNWGLSFLDIDTF